MNERTATMEERRTASTLEERLKAYRPEEYLDFSDPDVEARMREAIERVAASIARSASACPPLGKLATTRSGRDGSVDARMVSSRMSSPPMRIG